MINYFFKNHVRLCVKQNAYKCNLRIFLIIEIIDKSIKLTDELIILYLF